MGINPSLRVSLREWARLGPGRDSSFGQRFPIIPAGPSHQSHQRGRDAASADFSPKDCITSAFNCCVRSNTIHKCSSSERGQSVTE
jgi:hypothetical protein